MGKSSEQRRFARFILPVVIDAPELSDLPIVPEDISAGGFKVMITKEPPRDNPLSCSLHVSGEFFGNCQVKVAWTKKTSSVPASWQVGLAIELQRVQ